MKNDVSLNKNLLHSLVDLELHHIIKQHVSPTCIRGMKFVLVGVRHSTPSIKSGLESPVQWQRDAKNGQKCPVPFQEPLLILTYRIVGWTRVQHLYQLLGPPPKSMQEFARGWFILVLVDSGPLKGSNSHLHGPY